MNNNSVLTMNLDQSKNKYSKYPKTTTAYAVHAEPGLGTYCVVIYVMGREDRYLYHVSKKKIELLLKHVSVCLPGNLHYRNKTHLNLPDPLKTDYPSRSKRWNPEGDKREK